MPGMVRYEVDLGKLRQGLTKIAAAPSALDETAAPLIRAIHGWAGDAAIIVAQGDATGVAFRAAARGHGFAIETLATDSHSYADAMDALERVILTHLARAGSDGATPVRDSEAEPQNIA